jgi:hypothetical protein
MTRARLAGETKTPRKDERANLRGIYSRRKEEKVQLPRAAAGPPTFFDWLKGRILRGEFFALPKREEPSACVAPRSAVWSNPLSPRDPALFCNLRFPGLADAPPSDAMVLLSKHERDRQRQRANEGDLARAMSDAYEKTGDRTFLSAYRALKVHGLAGKDGLKKLRRLPTMVERHLATLSRGRVSEKLAQGMSKERAYEQVAAVGAVLGTSFEAAAQRVKRWCRRG